MYYTQVREESKDLRAHSRLGKYDSKSQSVIFADYDSTYRIPHCQLEKTYSYRSRRPRNAGSDPVYGENLIKRGPSINGYIASYRAAVNALQTEAESTASATGHSGRGLYDSGHSFYSYKTPYKTDVYTSFVENSYTAYESGKWTRHAWIDTRTSEFTVSAFHWLSLDNFGAGKPVDTATANAVQRLASATVPDRIRGSLGQDLVDLAQLPRFVSSLSRMARDLPSLAERWHRLSHRARAAIDYAFRHPGKASKAMARQAGSGYLEWLFVLQPYVDDMRLIANFLCKGSAQLLTRESFTRNADIFEKNLTSDTGGSYFDAGWTMKPHFEVNVKRSVHVAVAWMSKGVTPSDDYFLTKARSLNRALGLWYPSLLWDLAPWTWLLDWCLHFGDMIDNVDAIQRSGYNPIYSWATVRERAAVHYSLHPANRGIWLDGEHPGTVRGVALARYPFKVDGIQLPSFERLSSTQRNILTALGFSHLKH